MLQRPAVMSREEKEGLPDRGAGALHMLVIAIGIICGELEKLEVK